MKPLHTAEAAEDDIDAIIQWYDRQGPGLSDDFLQQLKVTLRYLREYPEMYAIEFDDIRGAHLHRIPYLAYYRNCANHIDLIGVLHERLDPAQVALDLLNRIPQQ